MSRVLIIGLDGGTFDLITPWVKEGKLPNIAWLIGSGVHGNLRTTIPPMTFPAWNAFMTGKNPGKHGVFDFTERKRGTFELEIKNALDRKSETIWRIATRYGKRCASIGIPVTYPPEEINGVMISGFDAPYSDERIMYPKELFFELREKVGPYLTTDNFIKPLRAGRIDKAVETMHRVIDRKAATARYLLGREPWDLFMIVFGETDGAIHHFWRYHDPNSPQRGNKFRFSADFDPVYEIYRRVDERIGELLGAVPDDTGVILMSDHGAGGTGDKVVYLNRLLEAHGFLAFKEVPVRRRVNTAIDRLKPLLKVILPKGWLKQIRFTPEGMGLKWESRLRFSAIDWRRTKAYAEETPYYPNITVNLKGREPDGVVEEHEYEDVVSRVIELLHEWKDPETGNGVVEKAYRRKDIYHGDYIDRTADIIISWNLDKGYAYMSGPSFASEKGVSVKKLPQKVFEKSDYMLNRSGSHRDKGIFIIAGDKIKGGARIEKAEITDLAPTILYLLDIPIPEDMDGEVLLSCFKEEHLRPPVFEGASRTKERSDYHYSDEETDRIKKRLKDLGYL